MSAPRVASEDTAHRKTQSLDGTMLAECLNEMLQCVAAILAPQDSFMVLNLYSNGYSAVLGETIVKQAFCMKTAYKSLDFGELVLKDSYGKNLPLSVFVRLAR